MGQNLAWDLFKVLNGPMRFNAPGAREGPLEGITVSWTQKTPPPWNVCSAHCSHNRSHSRPWERNVLPRPPELYMWLNILRPLYKLFLLQQQREPLIFETNLIVKFPCLWKLPPTNLGWPASFFSPSLPSVYWLHACPAEGFGGPI